MSGHAPDEEAAGVLVQRRRSAKEARQQGAKRADRYESAIVFLQEFSAEIGIAALNSSAGLAHQKIAFHIVVAQTPSAAVGFGAHFAEWLENFEQAYVVPTFPLHYGQGIVGRHRVDRKMFVRRDRR